jgi:hypothetical protein
MHLYLNSVLKSQILHQFLTLRNVTFFVTVKQHTYVKWLRKYFTQLDNGHVLKHAYNEVNNL